MRNSVLGQQPSTPLQVAKKTAVAVMTQSAEREIYLTLAQLAAVFNLTGATLQVWAKQGRGPAFVARKHGTGKLVRYRLADVERFVEERVVRPEAPRTKREQA